MIAHVDVQGLLAAARVQGPPKPARNQVGWRGDPRPATTEIMDAARPAGMGSTTVRRTTRWQGVASGCLQRRVASLEQIHR
jgi:hypothetical protein